MIDSTDLYSPHMATNITIHSWNVNGLRAGIRKGTFDAYLKKYDPDILCLQETKAHKEQVDVDFIQYEEYWNSADKKGYSGTAVFSKTPAITVTHDLDGALNLVDNDGRDAVTEGRVVTAEFEKFFAVSVYTPNAKDDLSRIPLRYNQWDTAFLAHIKKLEKKKPVIACGDFNVAHEDIDLANPKQNEGKKGFTKEERERFQDFLDAGFIDTLRAQYPDKKGLYTWWSPWANARERNVGWRIDYVLTSGALKNNVRDAFILPKVLGSDHCPVGIKLSV